MENPEPPSEPVEPPPIPPYQNPWPFRLLGIVAANVVIAVLYGGSILLLTALHAPDAAGWIAIPSFFLMPALGGLVAAFCWRPLRPTVGRSALDSLWATLAGLAAAAIFFREGSICLLMVSPLYYVMILIGALFGRFLLQGDTTRLRLAFLPLFALVTLGEPLTRNADIGVVTDELLIRASPAQVWPQVTAFADIPAPPRFWLFRIGLPYPMATTSAGDFVGADRRCIFSGGAVFKEKVAELEFARKLTFDIVESPRDPELIGHLTPRRGQFLLRDNHDGTTTLIGSTWYHLHVRPLWYFNAWTEHIFRAVHLRVMEDVRRRAEQSAGIVEPGPA